MTLINMPLYCLLWIALGGVLLVIGLYRLAIQPESKDYYTSLEEEPKDSHQSVEELLTYFLEEEEKKNEDFRKLLVQKEGQVDDVPELIKSKKVSKCQEMYNEIIELYNEGKSPEEIAKKLKKGTGEVKLILSLYNMR